MGSIIRINLLAAFYAIKAALPGMKARKWGRIINTASAHALVASPFKSAYVAAKHGISGLTKTVALETAQAGITVNAIAPGYVWTPLVEKQIPDTIKARGMTEEQVKHDVLLAAQPTKEFRHRRGACGTGAVPVLGCGQADHRHDLADGWRVDGAIGTLERACLQSTLQCFEPASPRLRKSVPIFGPMR